MKNLSTFTVAAPTLLAASLTALAAETHTVTFRRMNGTVLNTVQVAHGGAVSAPAGPDESADGLAFQRWDGAEKLSGVTNDVTCWALYEAATAKSPSTSIASSSIASRETPYSLDEYFQLYDTLAWSDEFSGSALDVGYGKNWQNDTWRNNDEVQTYTSGQNHSVSDGTLKLTCRRESSTKITSARINSQNRVEFRRGRCEIRAKITKEFGAFPAFWLMGEGESGKWPWCGELDVMEQINGRDWIAGTLHMPQKPRSTGDQAVFSNQGIAGPEDGVHWGDGFHRIGVIISELEIVWYVDDHIFQRQDIRDSRYDILRDYGWYVLLNFAFGSQWSGVTSADDSRIADFVSENFEIDYCRIFTNATEGNTVARAAASGSAALSGPVKATIWRGWQMKWGKSGADYFMNHLIGEETTHVRAALREYLGRDKTDIVMIHPRMSENSSNQRVPYDVPGYTALDLSPLSGMETGSGDANERMRGTVIFNAERFSRSNSAVDTIPLSSDKSFTNCVAFVAELVEKDTGAKVKVVSAYVSKTNGVENAGGVVEQGFSALFSKLDAMKDERVILLFQGDTWGTWDWMERRVNSALATSYFKLGQYAAWPAYQSAWATSSYTASAENPAPLSILKANGQASGVHTNQAFCATVRFEAEPTIEYGPLDTSAFSKRMTVAFSGVQSGVTLTNFPVLVKLSGNIAGFDYGDFAASDGGDLRFADSDGNILPHEIDTWDTNGVSTAWVKVPALSQNTTITACWGCSGTPPVVAPKDVWDDDYVGVWHLGEKLLPMKESSETTSDFTSTNGTGIAFAQTGVVGGSVDFSSGSNCSLVAPDHDLLDGFDKCTFEVWTWQDALGTNLGILSKRNSYQSEAAYYIMQSGSQTPLYMATSSEAQAKTILAPYPSAQAWNHLAYAIDTTTASDNVRSYKNGGAPATATKAFPGAILSNARDLVLGNLGKTAANPFNGLIDEVRISKCVRSADWIKATHDTIALANFATYSVDGSAQPSDTNLADLKLKASTDKSNPIDYAVGETIRFDFRLDGVEALPSSLNDRLPLCVVWNRTGDDGIATKGTNVISLSQGCSMSTSLALPGCVRVEAYLAGSNGQKLTYATSSGDTASITFSGGAGVATDEMSLSAEEPADFDAFWAEAKAKLAAVPFGDTNVVLEEVFPANASAATLGAYHFYAAKIPCLGPRPVTGWLVVPKNAAPGSLAVRATFAGYGCATAAPSPPNWGSPNEIRFEVNAHGYDLVGQNDQYYQNFNDSINKTGRTFGNTTYTYGLAPQDYENPTNTYFYYMALRVVRAFDYLKSRPEWDGTNVVAEGGSQGGLQTMWAGGLVDGISRIKPSITWGCDIGCPFNGQGQFVSRGWGIPCVPGAYYFDAALHAKRVPTDCTAVIERIGMGDYTCPPRGVLLSYYNMKCASTATLVQGSTHGYVPPQTNQTFVLSKAADVAVDPGFVLSGAAAEPGFSWTNGTASVTVSAENAEAVSAGAKVRMTVANASGAVLGTVDRAWTGAGDYAFDTAEAVSGAALAEGYDYTLSFSVVDAAGAELQGGAAAELRLGGEAPWFSADPATSVVAGGEWATTPAVQDGAYALADGATFAAFEERTGVARAEVTLPAVFAGESDLAKALAFATENGARSGLLAAQVAADPVWLGLVLESGGVAWKPLQGVAPVAEEDGFLHAAMELDLSGAAPRVSYLAAAADGSWTRLCDATGAAWFAAPGSGDEIAGVVDFCGDGQIGAFSGVTLDKAVAEAGGVRYDTLAEAIAAGNVTLLTNAEWPQNAPAGTIAIDRAGHSLLRGGVAVDGNTVVVDSGPVAITGQGSLRVTLGGLGSIGIETTGLSPAQLAALLAADGENHIPRWQSYVLGLDPTDPASLPYADIAVNGTSVSLSAEGMTINDAAGATVMYRAYEVKDLSDPTKDVPVGEPTVPGEPVEIPMGNSSSGFFRLRVVITIE